MFEFLSTLICRRSRFKMLLSSHNAMSSNVFWKSHLIIRFWSSKNGFEPNIQALGFNALRSVNSFLAKEWEHLNFNQENWMLVIGHHFRIKFFYRSCQKISMRKNYTQNDIVQWKTIFAKTFRNVFPQLCLARQKWSRWPKGNAGSHNTFMTKFTYIVALHADKNCCKKKLLLL